MMICISALTGMMLAKYGKEHVQNNLMNEDSLAVEAEALFDEYFDNHPLLKPLRFKYN